jgi:hypothetical protein
LDPRFHCEGKPGDYDQIVQLQKKVEGAGWVESAGCEEGKFGSITPLCVFIGRVRRLCRCRVWA